MSLLGLEITNLIFQSILLILIGFVLLFIFLAFGDLIITFLTDIAILISEGIESLKNWLCVNLSLCWE
jgi:small-conductance mechanosensitive channel